MPNKRRKGLKLFGGYIDEGLKEEVQQVGKRYKKNASDVIREALELWLREGRKKGKGGNGPGE